LGVPRLRAGDVEVKGKAALFVAFNDLPGKDRMSIGSRLEAILNFVRRTVVPALEPFPHEVK